MQELIPAVYEQLKRLARSHLRNEDRTPLEPTALVHEAFLKLVKGRHPRYENRAHFYGVAWRLTRQVRGDTPRRRAAENRAAPQELPMDPLPDVATQEN